MNEESRCPVLLTSTAAEAGATANRESVVSSSARVGRRPGKGARERPERGSGVEASWREELTRFWPLAAGRWPLAHHTANQVAHVKRGFAGQGHGTEGRPCPVRFHHTVRGSGRHTFQHLRHRFPPAAQADRPAQGPRRRFFGSTEPTWMPPTRSSPRADWQRPTLTLPDMADGRRQPVVASTCCLGGEGVSPSLRAVRRVLLAGSVVLCAPCGALEGETPSPQERCRTLHKSR